MVIREALQAQRRVLLDLTYRNRLLSLPKKPSARSINVHDERSKPVLAMLLDRKPLSFAPLSGPAAEEALAEDDVAFNEDDIILPQPEDDAPNADGIAGRHADNRLQTKLKSEHLQKRLLEIWYEARTLLEEQGVNVLYLALGQLRFRERPGSETFRSAPLLLVPVALERKSARDRFTIRWNEEDPQENLSLREKLRVEFGLRMPDFPEPEQLDIDAYFAALREVVASQDGWVLEADAIQLGFFSFAKLLMFLDLDPAKWPVGKTIDENPLVSGLLGEGFADDDAGLPASGSCFLDALVPAAELKHIMDCDSSQALAIETVRRGRNLVIQGPPGTGKSQTIANLIAAAVCDGRKVLFVAEKMAALEVVKRRLENVGLGALCLELHSNKANKKAVLEELGRTLALTRPADIDAAAGIEELDRLRNQLNAHVQRMHAPEGVAQWSPYAILGALARLLPRVGRPDYTLPDALRWTRADLDARIGTVRELCERLPRIGDPALHPWRGVTHPQVMRPQAEGMARGTRPLVEALARLRDVGRRLGDILGLAVPVDCADFERRLEIGARLVSAPDLDRSAIANPAWSMHLDALREVVRQGRILDEARRRRSGAVAEIAWGTDWLPQRMIVAAKAAACSAGSVPPTAKPSRNCAAWRLRCRAMPARASRCSTTWSPRIAPGPYCGTPPASLHPPSEWSGGARIRRGTSRPPSSTGSRRRATSGRRKRCAPSPRASTTARCCRPASRMRALPCPPSARRWNRRPHRCSWIPCRHGTVPVRCACRSMPCRRGSHPGPMPSTRCSTGWCMPSCAGARWIRGLAMSSPLWSLRPKRRCMRSTGSRPRISSRCSATHRSAIPTCRSSTDAGTTRWSSSSAHGIASACRSRRWRRPASISKRCRGPRPDRSVPWAR